MSRKHFITKAAAKRIEEMNSAETIAEFRAEFKGLEEKYGEVWDSIKTLVLLLALDNYSVEEIARTMFFLGLYTAEYNQEVPKAFREE